MRFYTNGHRFYCGVDLHGRSMYLCILDADGSVVFDKNLPATGQAFLQAIAPFRDGLVVAVESSKRLNLRPSILRLLPSTLLALVPQARYSAARLVVQRTGVHCSRMGQKLESVAGRSKSRAKLPTHE